MCMGMEYCASCRPTVEIEAWERGGTHTRPVAGDRAQGYAMTMRRHRAFLEALHTGDGEAWPEYHNESFDHDAWGYHPQTLEEIFTPEERAFISGATDDLDVVRLPFAQHQRLHLVVSRRVRNALRGFRKGEAVFMEWREFQFAMSAITTDAQENAQLLFLLLNKLSAKKSATRMAERKLMSRQRNCKRRILKLLKHVSPDFLHRAWHAHFASQEAQETPVPSVLQPIAA